VPPVHRLAATAIHPSRAGARTAAVWRTAKYELNTTLRGRPTVLPLGERSRIIAYPGETNSPLTAIGNPPNWPEMLVWRRYLRPGDLFIDVGANIGIYTLYAVECGAEAIAVEPVPHSAARVREHLELNGYEAEVVEKALASEPGVVRMTTGEDSYNHITTDGGGAEVEATTLDLLLGDRTAGVKIDVEGFEHVVLAGARQALAEQRISLLQLEWQIERLVDDREGLEDRSPVKAMLDEAGYVLCLPGSDGRLRAVDQVDAAQFNVFAVPSRRLDEL
jgi:FkbM family methyltransferase